MNTTNKFFETKQQYLDYRAAFAKAQNDPRSKKKFVDGTGLVCNRQTYTYSRVAIKVREYGWMSSVNYLLMNIIRGRPLYSGFVTKLKGLDNGTNPVEALQLACAHLKSLVQDAKNVIEPTTFPFHEHYSKIYSKGELQEALQKEQKKAAIRVTNFLEKYEGALTVNDLAKIDVTIFPDPNWLYKTVKSGKVTYPEIFATDLGATTS